MNSGWAFGAIIEEPGFTIVILSSPGTVQTRQGSQGLALQPLECQQITWQSRCLSYRSVALD